MMHSAAVPTIESFDRRFLASLMSATAVCAVALMPSASAYAQSNDNEWIRPTGGSWNNPRNWSLGFVPTPETDAYFRLDDDLAVSTTGGGVFELLVQGSRVELFAPGCGNDGGSGLQANVIRVQNDVQGAGRRGVFRLLDASCGKTQGIVTLVNPPAGIPDGINELGLAGNTIFLTENLTVHPLAGVSFSVRDELPEAAMALILGESTVEGGLRLRGLDERFPEPGAVIDLLDATETGPADRVLLPRFGYLEPPVDRDLAIGIQTNEEGWDRRLSAEVRDAATTVDLEPTLADATSLELVELVTDDFDGDGRSDLAGFYANGVLAVLLQQPDGSFEPALFDQGLDDDVVDGTAGDFDGNGAPDLAVIARTGTESGVLRLYLNDGSGDSGAWSVGPAGEIAGVPVSLAPIGGDPGLKQPSRGIAVSSDLGNRGETASYKTTADTVVKTGGVEVGDEPGPSDPIEDENKKDPDPPLGVGNTATALGGTGVARFSVLQPLPEGGFEPLQQITLPGRCLDFASGDLDGDGRPETLVITDNDALVLLRPLQNETAARAVAIPPDARSIAIGDVDADGEPEVVIGFNKAIRIHAIRLAPTPGAVAGEAGVFLEVERTIQLDGRTPARLAIGQGGFARLMSGFETDEGSDLFAGVVREIANDPCSAADLDGDGQVGSSDLGLLIAAWGDCSGCPADINGDGKVDGGDLAQIIAFWGPC